ncbi:aldo/keto reductase [Citricoccus muralis]|uniref:Aldo/keto reductase n=1 Tax=Citricoccus muralis TaxID=169134 RepID=A0ABY8H414_9MICC|nr:aldo/keto reductase [Citricoccus muralis]WFP15864.1 aldo/keto reductase [Citricoccus muralis]
MTLAERTQSLSLSGTHVDGVAIPQIGLGTWPMVGQECTDAVVQALSIGYRHVDTAENYRNEDAVGEALRRTEVPRDQIFLTTKFNREHHGPLAAVRAAVEQRLSLLGVNEIDLMLIHWPNPDQGKYVETAGALAELVQAGLIRAWGVSNFTAEHLADLRKAGLQAPINQIQVDPLASQPRLRAVNAEAGTLTAAYSPVGRDVDLNEYEALTAPAARLGVTAHQVALRWHVQSGRVAVPKSANAGRQEANLDVFGFELTDEDMTGIDALDTGAGPRLDPNDFGH